MIKIIGNNKGKSNKPGYFLTSKGIIDSNLQYTGCIVRITENCGYKRVKDDGYLIIFDIDWQGEFFECVTPTKLIILVYNQPRIDDQVNHNINHYTYHNYHEYFLKIPNTIYIMWHDNLINKNELISSYYSLKSIMLPELSLIIHYILLELIRNDYDHYKMIDISITDEAKSLAKHCYNIDL